MGNSPRQQQEQSDQVEPTDDELREIEIAEPPAYPAIDPTGLGHIYGYVRHGQPIPCTRLA